ncbi:MAG: hypothetical protein OXF06_01565 [Bacteroidetes bacterium]|nr:hypothetical protein [Bacteroidota bacterium]
MAIAVEGGFNERFLLREWPVERQEYRMVEPYTFGSPYDLIQ